MNRTVLSRVGLLIGMLGVSACGLLGGGAPAPIEDRLHAAAPAVARPPAAPAPADDADLGKVLYGHFREWQGTPYRLGGNSRSGIDCSAYVAQTFRMLGVDLPRTTDEQAARGRRVTRDELGIGDLVFFRTGLDSRHVGIYLDRGEFMHASRRKGVMISNLHNRYWRAKFWQARRVHE
ncbi:MAG: NlpC/P60 family protein [Gammaproteobacteria bacterium]